jgi:hypothetical protein
MIALELIDLTVSPWGFNIEVTACLDHGEPATYEHPGWPPECSIESARVGGVNVYDMLDNWQLTRLEEAVLRACDL